MIQIEDANYNVTQGYKAFKELKELRNSRKEKQREIDSLKPLVQCFDCEAMLEAYKYNQGVMEEVMEMG